MTSKLQRSAASRAPRIFLGVLLATTALAAHPDAFAQNTGYLSGHEVDFHTVLGPPPAVDSPLDRADQAAVMAYQDVDDARRQEAKLDERQLYSRFAEAFGRPIDERSSPTVVTILDRALRDVDFTASRA